MTPVAFGQPVEATHSLRLKLGGDLELGVLLCAWGLNPRRASSGCHELSLYSWYLQRALLGVILLRYVNAFNIDVFLFPVISPTAAGIKITFRTSSGLKAIALMTSFVAGTIFPFIILYYFNKVRKYCYRLLGGRERRVLFKCFSCFSQMEPASPRSRLAV